jgi:mannosylglycerate hydrolase
MAGGAHDRMTDAQLRDAARAVLEKNRHGDYTVPAIGLYPYQWCWDTGPIILGWASLGEWDHAWGELDKLMSAQWESGMVPHIVFWEQSDDYFPGPDVWDTRHTPPTTGLTQPPLPVSAAARLAAADPDAERARAQMSALWPKLVAWLAWIDRARRGPHGASAVVHPWESGMDNSPAWDAPLAATPETSNAHLERRDVKTVSANERPSTKEYRHYLGIVEALRDAGWDTERQMADSPFAVEDPAFTAITARAADDLAALATTVGEDAADVHAIAARARAGIASLWDDELGWYRAFDVRAGTFTGPATVAGLAGMYAGVDDDRSDRTEQVVARLDAWSHAMKFEVASSDPHGDGFDPIRYWRGPVWVLVNWLAADAFARASFTDRASSLCAQTRVLVEQGFNEYYDPRDGTGIGGEGFSWSAALTLYWLTT